MIASVECKNCYGEGRMHSNGRNGDPFDDGVDCPVCKGTGVVDVDLNEEGDDTSWDDEEHD